MAAAGCLLAPTALWAQDRAVDRVGIYLAALEVFWGHRGGESAGSTVPYHFSTGMAEAPIPGPLFDSVPMRRAGIDPAIDLHGIEGEVTAAERERLETEVAERWRIHLVFATDTALQQVRRGVGSGDMGEAFHVRFDGARNLLTLSRVAMSDDGRVASLDVSSTCGGRCGGGWSYLLRHDDTGWAVVTPSRVGRVY